MKAIDEIINQCSLDDDEIKLETSINDKGNEIRKWVGKKPEEEDEEIEDLYLKIFQIPLLEDL